MDGEWCGRLSVILVHQDGVERGRPAPDGLASGRLGCMGAASPRKVARRPPLGVAGAPAVRLPGIVVEGRVLLIVDVTPPVTEMTS